MTTSIETFTGQEDRARVLGEILRRATPFPGTTLVAHIDRVTQEVLGVRSTPTPRPVLDAESCFDDDLIHYLNELLCITAQELVPERTWVGPGWSPITGELVTVVCREGPAEITSTETQYWWGWRYSNHLTAAFDSDVYVVTPQGWAAMLGDWCGPAPALPLVGPPLDDIPVVGGPGSDAQPAAGSRALRVVRP